MCLKNENMDHLMKLLLNRNFCSKKTYKFINLNKQKSDNFTLNLSKNNLNCKNHFSIKCVSCLDI